MTETASEGMLESFRNKAREWAQEVVKVYNTPVPKELETEKGALLKSAALIKKSVEGIFGTLDEFAQIGLGFLPLLIPAAVILGASAAIYKWYTDYEAFKKKLAYHKMLTESGETPGSASKIIGDLTSGNVDSLGSKKLLIIGAAIVGGYFIFKKIKR